MNIQKIINAIENSGYLNVNGVVRRWIPSQCLNMIFSEEGFHQQLKNRKYNYSWKVLIDELKIQRKLYLKQDFSELSDRQRWYDAELAYKMAEHYIQLLKVRQLLYENSKEVIPFQTLINILTKASNNIQKANNCEELYKTVIEFNRKRPKLLFSSKPLQMCPEFINAYKAAGAYYTIKDLIMFENCHFPNATTEESLNILENKVKTYSPIYENGYKLLGLLKEFLKINNFNYETTLQKWYLQSAHIKLINLHKKGLCV